MIVLKKRLFTALVFLMTLSFSSCIVTPSTPEDDGAIYGKNTETQVVMNVSEGLNLLELVARIGEACGVRPELVPDIYAEADHEIVVGNTERSITAAAKQAMARAIDSADIPEDEKKWYLHYMIYSDGDSVALVWSDGLAQEEALDYFMNEYVKGESLKLDAGYEKLVSVNKIETMHAEEAAQREEKYAEIAEELGQDVADALRNHMSIYDERFYLWLADLYDPGEYDENGNPLGGGFYYSNSARESQGYLIDIESTKQAIGFLSSSGMLKSYKNQIPEKMQKEMVAFALSLQDSEDGYFYHPQWGKNISIGRLSRDVGSATSIMSWFGYKPYWNAPNGTKGLYGEPGVSKTASLGDRSGVKAVSEVAVAASGVDRWPERLRSLENWEKYLLGYESEIHIKSYSFGHTVAEQCSQINTRDAEAAENGEPTGYAELTIQYFNRWQEETQQALAAQSKALNGLWEEEVSYNSLNGLMKISAIYVGLGADFNYAEEALASAVEIIMLEDPDVNGKEANGSVDVYNPWIAISRIFSILNKHGNETLTDKMRDTLRAQAADMIRVTTKKTVKFRKDDGSYGYTWDYSPAYSQGALAAVPNTVEGDVNGGSIALVGVTGNMLSALGISGLTIYAPSDLEIFLDRVSGLSHVVKEEIAVEAGPVDFEDGELGEDLPGSVTVTLTDGSAEIVDGGFESERALRFVTVPDKGDRLFLKSADTSTSKSCYVLEWDMRFEQVNASAATAMQITLGNMYMLTVGIKTDGALTFGDSSATDSSAITSSFDGSFNGFDWHHVRVEHYREGESQITCLYVDGALLGASDNYVGKQSATVNTPKFNNSSFYALFGADYTVLFDNLYSESTADVYGGDPSTEPDVTEPYDGYIDFDDAEPGAPSISGISVKPNPEEGNSIEIAEDPLDENNLALKLVAKPSKTAGNWIYVNMPDGEGSGSYFFETDIYVKTMGSSRCGAQLYFYSGSTAVFAMDISFVISDGGVTLIFDEKTADGGRNEVFLRVDEVIDSYFTLSVELDPETCVATVTVTTENEKYSAETDAYYKEETKRLTVDRVAFYTLFGSDVELYLDNIVAEK